MNKRSFSIWIHPSVLQRNMTKKVGSCHNHLTALGEWCQTQRSIVVSEDYADWYEPADPEPRHTCPCCDYVTLPERGNYLICPVCYWEDDGLDLDAPDTRSGPNIGMTIREARQNFRNIGACELKMREHVCSEAERRAYHYVGPRLP
ncbi:MAG: CPCC family cysteine-rich protein [Pseudomonadota bacterium]